MQQQNRGAVHIQWRSELPPAQVSLSHSYVHSRKGDCLTYKKTALSFIEHILLNLLFFTLALLVQGGRKYTVPCSSMPNVNS